MLLTSKMFLIKQFDHPDEVSLSLAIQIYRYIKAKPHQYLKQISKVFLKFLNLNL